MKMSRSNLSGTEVQSRTINGQVSRPGTARPQARQSNWAARVAAVCGAALLLLGLFYYPTASPVLILTLAGYVALLYWRPSAWLLVLPSVLVLVNLAPWSGSFFLEDFDFFVLATFAVLAWRDTYGGAIRALSAADLLSLGLLAASFSVSLVRGLLPLTPLDANAFSSYYSHYNALRIAKPFLWAVLLLPALAYAFRSQGERARTHLAWGMSIAVFALGCVVLWERGTVSALLAARDRYDVIGSLFDFTSIYRITGLFADMHTGGEAIDGFLALSVAFAIVTAFRARTALALAFGSAAAILGLYSAAVTFSRASYLAAGATVLSLALITLAMQAKREPLPWSASAGSLASMGLLAYGFPRGGTLLLFSGLLAFGAAVVLGRARRRLPLGLVVAGGLVLAAFAGYGAARGMLTSKFRTTDPALALALAGCLGGAVAAGGTWLGVRLSSVRLRSIVLGLAICLGGAAVMIPALLGYRMESRLSEGARDLQTRVDHWRDAISIMDPGLGTQLLGMGLGRFPETYFWTRGVDSVGQYRFVREAGNQFLSLRAGKDLRYGQRVSLPAYRTYTLTLDVRPQSVDVPFTVVICRRNIIDPYDWYPQCPTFSPNLTGKVGQWRHLRWRFNLGEVGDGTHWARLPLVFELTSLREKKYLMKGATRVDVDNVSLVDDRGAEYLRNGDFEQGAAAWFPYFDFSHLPWHTKNVWVAIYFDQGWLGIVAVAALVLAAVRSGLRHARLGDSNAVATVTAIIAFLVVGLFGTLTDVPRIMFLFYLLLFTLLVMPTVRGARPPVGASGKRAVVSQGAA
jgi:hypothetical protein